MMEYAIGIVKVLDEEEWVIAVVEVARERELWWGGAPRSAKSIVG